MKDPKKILVTIQAPTLSVYQGDVPGMAGDALRASFRLAPLASLQSEYTSVPEPLTDWGFVGNEGI